MKKAKCNKRSNLLPRTFQPFENLLVSLDPNPLENCREANIPWQLPLLMKWRAEKNLLKHITTNSSTSQINIECLRKPILHWRSDLGLQCFSALLRKDVCLTIRSKVLIRSVKSNPKNLTYLGVLNFQNDKKVGNWWGIKLKLLTSLQLV